MLQILKPTIFPQNILAGYTEINLSLRPNLPNGLDFKTVNRANFDKSLSVLAEFLGLNKASFVTSKQEHGDSIFLANDPSLDYFSIHADALVTENPEIIPCVRSADCGNLLIFDSVSGLRAVAHSGYKGTTLNIVGKTIDFMVKLGASAKDLLIFMGPSIEQEALWVWKSVVVNCPDEFKVCIHDLDKNSDLAKYLPLGFTEINHFPTLEQPAYLLNLNSWLKYQLLQAGVLPQNIEIVSQGTFSNARFHSQRRARIVHQSAKFGLGLGFIAQKFEIN